MTLPKISIVTPTYNSAHYLEATIQSLLAQQYPALEYIIMDGGSTDGTLAIIERYQSHLAYHVSEPDSGMYDALDKGFRQSTGDIMGWLNSDDMLPTWALHTVASVFNALPQVDWITSIRPLIWNRAGQAVDAMALPGFSKAGFLRGEHLPGQRGYVVEAIQQESTFWRRSLWEKAGAQLDTGLCYAGDFELWARFYQHSDLVGVRTPFGGFRAHGNQLSIRDGDAYYQEALAVLYRYGGKLSPAWRNLLRRYLGPVFRHRLRRLGAKVGICNPTRIAVYNQQEQAWQLRTEYV